MGTGKETRSFARSSFQPCKEDILKRKLKLGSERNRKKKREEGRRKGRGKEGKEGGNGTERTAQGIENKPFPKVNSYVAELGLQSKIECALTDLVENIEVYFLNIQTSYIFSIDAEAWGHYKVF